MNRQAAAVAVRGLAQGTSWLTLIPSPQRPPFWHRWPAVSRCGCRGTGGKSSVPGNRAVTGFAFDQGRACVARSLDSICSWLGGSKGWHLHYTQAGLMTRVINHRISHFPPASSLVLLVPPAFLSDLSPCQALPVAGGRGLAAGPWLCSALVFLGVELVQGPSVTRVPVPARLWLGHHETALKMAEKRVLPCPRGAAQQIRKCLGLGLRLWEQVEAHPGQAGPREPCPSHASSAVAPVLPAALQIPAASRQCPRVVWQIL